MDTLVVFCYNIKNKLINMYTAVDMGNGCYKHARLVVITMSAAVVHFLIKLMVCWFAVKKSTLQVIAMLPIKNSGFYICYA